MITNPIYNPRAGSIADRAMAHLRAHGLTANVPLADAIDADPGAMSASLSTAVRFGAVCRQTINGVLCWSLGDDNPANGQVQVDDDPIMQRVVPAAEALQVERAGPVVETRPPEAVMKPPISDTKPPESETPAVGTEPGAVIALTQEVPPAKPEQASSAAPPELRIAYWSDGSLQLRRGDADLALLSADEIPVLMTFLDRVIG